MRGSLLELGQKQSYFFRSDESYNPIVRIYEYIISHFMEGSP
jgi:hypothetical protein